MNNPYEGYKNLSNASVKERINVTVEVALERLRLGTEIDLMEETIEGFLEDEQYESAAGVVKAIKKFKKNPQLSIF